MWATIYFIIGNRYKWTQLHQVRTFKRLGRLVYCSCKYLLTLGSCSFCNSLNLLTQYELFIRATEAPASKKNTAGVMLSAHETTGKHNKKHKTAGTCAYKKQLGNAQNSWNMHKNSWDMPKTIAGICTKNQ